MADSGSPASGNELPSSGFPGYELFFGELTGFPNDHGEGAPEVSPETPSLTAHAGALFEECVPHEAEGCARPEHHSSRAVLTSLVQSNICDYPIPTATGPSGSQEATGELPASGLYRTDTGVLLCSSDVQRTNATLVTTQSGYDISTTTHRSSNAAGSVKLAIPRIATSSACAPKAKPNVPCTEQDCKVTFGRKSDLQRHLDKVHLHCSKRYECGAATCGYRTPRKDKMDEHVRNASGDHVGREAPVRDAFSVSRSTSSLASTGNLGSFTTLTDESTGQERKGYAE